MKIIALNTNEINQNGYHINKITQNKIGMIFTSPVNYVPEDCLACNGYILKIDDYKKLYSIIGTDFNKGNELEDEFRIPDYNITKIFLQAGINAGQKIPAGLPRHTHNATCSSDGLHTHVYTDYFASFQQGHGGDYPLVSSNNQHTDRTTSSEGEHTHIITIADASDTIYGASSTVQPPSQIVQLCIKYK